VTVKSQPKQITRESVAKSMRRILFQFPPGAETKGYFEAIYEAIKTQDIPDDLFDAACLRLASTMLPYKPPVASEYLAAVRAISYEQKRRKDNCQKCLGRGGFYVRDPRDPDGRKDAWSLCPECSR
jgi:hypothetical protein